MPCPMSESIPRAAKPSQTTASLCARYSVVNGSSSAPNKMCVVGFVPFVLYRTGWGVNQVSLDRLCDSTPEHNADCLPYLQPSLCIRIMIKEGSTPSPIHQSGASTMLRAWDTEERALQLCSTDVASARRQAKPGLNSCLYCNGQAHLRSPSYDLTRSAHNRSPPSVQPTVIDYDGTSMYRYTLHSTIYQADRGLGRFGLSAT